MIIKTAFLSIAALLAVGCGSEALQPIDKSSTSSSATSSSGSGGMGSGGSGATTSTTASSSSGMQGGCNCSANEVCVDAACHAFVTLDTSMSGASGTCSIVSDAKNVYWRTGDVHRVAISGENPVAIAPDSDEQSDLVVDDTYIYRASLGIARAKKDDPFTQGTNPWEYLTSQTMYPGHMTAYASDALVFEDTGGIYQITRLGPANFATVPTPVTDTWGGVHTPIGVNSTSVYFWHDALTGLGKVDWATPAKLDKLGPGLGKVSVNGDAKIVIDGDTVYFSTLPQTTKGGVVAAMPAGGGAAQIVVDDKQGSNGVFAVDDKDIYFMTPAGVNRVPKAGGKAVLIHELVTPSPFPSCISTDSQYVYWVEGASLMKYTK